MWKLEICEDWNIIWSEAYQKRWHDLLEKSPNAHVFFHPALIKAWVKTYLSIRNITPLFIWGTNEDNIVFLPLILWKKNWKNAYLKTIVPAGYSDFDYHDPIFLNYSTHATDTFWQEVIETLKSNYNFDEIVLDGLHNKNSLSLSFKTTHKEPCPFFSIKDFTDIAQFKESLHRKLRLDINRRIKKLNNYKDVNFIEYNKESIKSGLNILPHMLEIHSQRWPNAYKAPHFHANLIEEGLKSNIIHFSQINIGQTPISWRIGFYYKNRYYSYMPTINPDYLTLSPGKIHLLFCIEQAINMKIEIFDQLRGAESYKSEWTDNCEYIYNFIHTRKGINTCCKKQLIKIKALLV